MEDLSRFRQTEFPIDPLFRDHWSLWALSGEELDPDKRMALCEAAWWAPSPFNNQPWRFICARRETQYWQGPDLPVECNRGSAHAAAGLIIMASKNTSDSGKPSVIPALGTGAAWENLCLEGARRGLVVHGMAAAGRREREVPPGRKPLSGRVFEGRFPHE